MVHLRERPLDLLLAFEHLLLDEVVEGQRLSQTEQVLGPPVALQALLELLCAGLHLRVAEDGQCLHVPLARDDGADDGHAGLYLQVRGHLVQLHVEQLQRLAHQV